MNVEELLSARLRPAFVKFGGIDADPVVHRSRRADFQADGVLALAQRLSTNPRDLAQQIVDGVDLSDLCATVEVAGPGFINLTLSNSILADMTTKVASDPRLGVREKTHPDVVVVDYSAPNTAKEMHVGHLRSTVIGDAIVRLLEFCGDTVVRQNHLGDWGTPFGMLIEHMIDIGESEAAHELSVGDLSAFYQAARRKFEADEQFADRARQRVVLLQAGNPETLHLWHILVEQSTSYFMAVYARLGVRLTEADFVGESAYNDELPKVVEELDGLGLLEQSDGATCIFPDGFVNREGERLPLIVKKSDGGYGYDATDLAAIRHRVRELHADRILYVVGLPQSLHLRMVFEAARAAGWLANGARAQHVGFGSVLGPDGKVLRTRAGESIKLIDLLDEATRRARSAVEAKNPGLPTAETRHVADMIGIGAIKYADLSTDRNKDYTFDYDRMLSFDGNTGPYLQYAHTRICSILRKGETSASSEVGPIVVSELAEHKLAVELLAFGPLIAQLAVSLELHSLCTYLFGLATSFTSFYDSCPVLKSDPAVRASRLALCALTARVLATGLGVLGMEAPSRM